MGELISEKQPWQMKYSAQQSAKPELEGQTFHITF